MNNVGTIDRPGIIVGLGMLSLIFWVEGKERFWGFWV